MNFQKLIQSLKKRKKLSIVVGGCFAVICIGSFSYIIYKTLTRDKESTIEEVQEETKADHDYLSSKRSFADVVINIPEHTPKLKPYDVQDTADISNINRFSMNESAEKKVSGNNFVVVERGDIDLGSYRATSFEASYGSGNDLKNNEFFPVYEENRYNLIPSFITTDSILHS